eukprot:TRINITY_DN668_c0_g2_i5.p1 TRINITY_DN668_c0_g2~~TRINITY_DN668_c0_g2_i5.p1  ORF type:complete len:328 (+),score=64.91 TRINITY_DN668_c0_g2_i5:583-1566(+)
MNHQLCLFEDVLVKVEPSWQKSTLSTVAWKGLKRIPIKFSESQEGNIFAIDHTNQTAIITKPQSSVWINLVDKKVLRTLSQEVAPKIQGYRRDPAVLWRNLLLTQRANESVVWDLDSSIQVWTFKSSSWNSGAIHGVKVAILTVLDRKAMVTIHDIHNNTFVETPWMDHDGSADLKMDAYKLVFLGKRGTYLSIFDVQDGSLMQEFSFNESYLIVRESEIKDRILLASQHLVISLDFSEGWKDHKTEITCITTDENSNVEFTKFSAERLFQEICNFLKSETPICECIPAQALKIYRFRKPKSEAWLANSFPGAWTLVQLEFNLKVST